MWGLVALVALMTIAVSLGTMTSHSQKDTSKQQGNKWSEELNKYAIADYDAPLPENLAEREERKQKNKRYDNQDFVRKNPHPDDAGVGRSDEEPPPSIIPVAESELVIVGEIIKVDAYLSNDKKGIYSEFTVRVDEVLKSVASSKIEQGTSISVDRAGGIVRYPNGQKVLYTISGRDLPQGGKSYVLFLTSQKENPNYQILTGYELKESDVSPLDMGRNFEGFKNIGKQNFIKAVRNKISESLQPVNN